MFGCISTDTVEKKRDIQRSLIEVFANRTEKTNTAITEIADVYQLAETIASGQVKSVDVTLAYIQKHVFREFLGVSSADLSSPVRSRLTKRRTVSRASTCSTGV